MSTSPEAGSSTEAGPGPSTESEPEPATPAEPENVDASGLRLIAEAAESLPFNRLLGLRCDEQQPGRAVVVLPEDERLTNHIGSVHAVAELAPAEAAGGVAAVTGLRDLVERGYLPVARSLAVRYRRLASGTLTAVAELPEGIAAGARTAADAGERIAFELDVDVRDSEDTVAEVRIEYVFKHFGAAGPENA